MKTNGTRRDVKVDNRPPKGMPWVWLTCEIMASDACRSASINARRVIDFLLLEHMGKGGTANGKLKAPYRQLEDFGVSKRLVAASIAEVERLGLVRAIRGGRRVATMYRLTWLPGHDGSPATNDWKNFRNPALRPMAARKSRNLPAGERAALPANVRADAANLPAYVRADDR